MRSVYLKRYAHNSAYKISQINVNCNCFDNLVQVIWQWDAIEYRFAFYLMRNFCMYDVAHFEREAFAKWLNLIVEIYNCKMLQSQCNYDDLLFKSRITVDLYRLICRFIYTLSYNVL